MKEIVFRGEGEFLDDEWFDERKTIDFFSRRNISLLYAQTKEKTEDITESCQENFKNSEEKSINKERRESVFGSLTNEFGDRLKVSNKTSMQVRILRRIISYQIKLLIRCDDKKISVEALIIRHAWLKYSQIKI